MTARHTRRPSSGHGRDHATRNRRNRLRPNRAPRDHLACRDDLLLRAARLMSKSALKAVKAEPPASTAKVEDKPRLLFFYSPTSGRDRRVEGFLAQVLQRNRNQQTFSVHRIDIAARPDLAARFRIRDDTNHPHRARKQDCGTGTPTQRMRRAHRPHETLAPLLKHRRPWTGPTNRPPTCRRAHGAKARLPSRRRSAHRSSPALIARSPKSMHVDHLRRSPWWWETVRSSRLQQTAATADELRK